MSRSSAFPTPASLSLLAARTPYAHLPTKILPAKMR